MGVKRAVLDEFGERAEVLRATAVRGEIGEDQEGLEASARRLPIEVTDIEGRGLARGVAKGDDRAARGDPRQASGERGSTDGLENQVKARAVGCEPDDDLLGAELGEALAALWTADYRSDVSAGPVGELDGKARARRRHWRP